MSKEIRKYKPAGAVIQAFHWSDALVRQIVGPVGSGKSYACCNELFRRACEQAPDSHGVRRTRWAIIRQSYPELRDTTAKTWLDVFPEATFGPFQKQSPMRAHHHFKMNDGTTVDAEYIFLSLDHETDESKLMSLELTGAFINESQFIRKSVLNKLLGRVGRYPSVAMGGATWRGVILDTNPPDVGNWIYKTFVLELPDSFELYHQPSGAGPNAENIDNLIDGYYEQVSTGQTQSYIDAMVHGKFSYSESESAIHPKFSPTSHVAKQIIKPNPSYQTYIGMDFGATPAAAFIQHNSSINQWLVTDEICLYGASAEDIAEAIKQLIGVRYSSTRPQYFGDPAGNHPGQQVKASVFDILAANGLDVRPASRNNNFDIRRATLDHLLNMRTVTGDECFLISPNCPTLISGLAGAYHWKKVQSGGVEKLGETAEKTKESHICEALHYGLLGAGLGEVVLTSKEMRGRPYRKPKVITSRGQVRA